jgi:hypothetical protein
MSHAVHQAPTADGALNRDRRAVGVIRHRRVDRREYLLPAHYLKRHRRITRNSVVGRRALQNCTFGHVDFQRDLLGAFGREQCPRRLHPQRSRSHDVLRVFRHRVKHRAVAAELSCDILRIPWRHPQAAREAHAIIGRQPDRGGDERLPRDKRRARTLKPKVHRPLHTAGCHRHGHRRRQEHVSAACILDQRRAAATLREGGNPRRLIADGLKDGSRHQFWQRVLQNRQRIGPPKIFVPGSGCLPGRCRLRRSRIARRRGARRPA